MSFERAVEFVLAHEGEWSDDPQDAGKRTRWGISSRAHPEVNLDTLTRDQAIEIYRRRYWLQLRGDELPDALAFVLLDWAVHNGVEPVVRQLQTFVGAKIDGKLGPRTLEAVRRVSARSLVRVLLHQRAEFRLEQARKPGQEKFAGGWINRVIDVALEVG